MKRLRIAILICAFMVVLATAAWLFFNTAAGVRSQMPKSGKVSLFAAIRAYWQKRFPPRATVSITITGTTGTPVVVGFLLDGSRSQVTRGFIPTNLTVRARGKVDILVKNVGTSTAEIGFTSPPRVPAGISGGVRVAPSYGLHGVIYWGPMQSGSSSNAGEDYPTNWPVTLPPGMTWRQAATNDFTRDLRKIQLKDHEDRLAKDPQNHRLMEAVGRLNFWLKNFPTGEEAYAKLFASDCKDPVFLNLAAWWYIEYGGTNLDRALEAARKALSLAPGDPYTADTVAWFRFKQGYYEEALRSLPRIRNSGTSQAHFGLIYYMLMRPEEARKELEAALPAHPEPAERREATNCLAILNLSDATPRPTALATLRHRLAEMPDDPMALNRLGAMYNNPTGAEAKLLQDDPLLLKAVGVRAYQSGDYSKAVENLAAISQKNTNDGGVIYYLAMSQIQLNQTNGVAELVARAKALPITPAMAEQLDNALAKRTAQ